MARARPLRLAPEWDDRFTRMVGVSAVAHVLAVIALVVVAERVGTRPLPITAYTVQLTDARDLGGRLPPGSPGRDPSGGPVAPAPAAPKPAPPSPPAEETAKATPAPEPEPTPPSPPKPAEPAVQVPEPPKPVEAKPEPQPEP